jgi:ribosomal protein L1
MAQHGKKYMAALEKIDRTRLYEPGEAIGIIKETASAKFDETIELHIRTGLDDAARRAATPRDDNPAEWPGQYAARGGFRRG